jgi:hypothetical protein
MELVIRIVFHVFLASFLNFLSRLVLWVVMLLVVSPLFIARHHLVLCNVVFVEFFSRSFNGWVRGCVLTGKLSKSGAGYSKSQIEE